MGRLLDEDEVYALFAPNGTARLHAADIDALPRVDAVEVTHGRWLYDSGSGKYFCSACDEYALSFKKDTLYGGDLYEVCLTDYCPNCGAKMDLEDKE